MIPIIDLNNGSFRLLKTDNDLFLPVNTEMRLIVSSADVIHCLTTPLFQFNFIELNQFYYQ